MTALALGRDQESRHLPRIDQRYQQLVELAPDAVLIHNNGVIVLANAAAVRLAGAHRRADLLGNSIDDYLTPPFLKAVAHHLTEIIGPDEVTAPVRDRFRRHDGSTVEVEVRAVAFLDDGTPAAHLVIRDITGRLAVELAARQLVEELHQAHRLESVGALAGGMAHEVHNMMQVVLGFSDFLLRHAGLPRECQGDVKEIMKAAERATTVTRQLLAFSRRAIHRPATVDLCDAVRDASQMVRLLLGEGRRLVVETRAEARAWVDPGQLEQVLMNLTLNARDAMPGGGVLNVQAAVEEVTQRVATPDGGSIPPGRYATIAVTDTGCGIEPAIMAEIFTPFFTTKTVGSGVGLGLAAVQGILSQNNGFIGVCSTPGQGSTFTVYLPALREGEFGNKHPAIVPGSSASTHAGATILVVDDEPGVRTMAARVLERDGYRVLQAAGGADALELLGRLGPPQLVLTDLMMPGIGGFQLAERLKARWPSLPVLMMTGYSAEEVQRSDPQAVPPELLQKPFMPAELTRRVAALLEVDLPVAR